MQRSQNGNQNEAYFKQLFVAVPAEIFSDDINAIVDLIVSNQTKELILTLHRKQAANVAYQLALQSIYRSVTSFSATVQKTLPWYSRWLDYPQPISEKYKNAAKFIQDVGDYAAYELSQQNLQRSASLQQLTTLIHLSVLRDSRTLFLTFSQSSYSKTLSDVAYGIHTFRENARVIKAGANDFEKRCADLANANLILPITQQITSLKQSRMQRWFGWYNKQIAALNQLQKTLEPITIKIVGNAQAEKNKELEIYTRTQVEQKRQQEEIQRRQQIKNEFDTAYQNLQQPKANIEIFINATIAMMAIEDAAYKQHVEKTFAEIKDAIIAYVKDPQINGDKNKIAALQNLMKLFALTRIEKTKNLAILESIRIEISKAVAAIIDTLTDENFDKRIEAIQKIWPEPLQSQFIRIRNNSNHAIQIESGSRLSELEDVTVSSSGSFQVSSQEANSTVSEGSRQSTIGIGIPLPAGEQHVFWCDPISKDSVIDAAISKKLRIVASDMGRIARIESNFSADIEFLKSGKQGWLQTLKKKLGLQASTPLTEASQKEHVDKLINNYIELMDSDSATILQRKHARTFVARHVEEISQDLDASLNSLLNANSADIGRVLLQWQFITKFRERYGVTDITERLGRSFRYAGSIIVSKLDETAKQNGKFIHNVLGRMNAEQLNALNDTFVSYQNLVGISRSNYKEVFKLDFDGSAKKVDSEYTQTVLSRSMLLSQVSVVVVDELNDFINGRLKDLKAFEEHITFVCAHLNEKQQQELDLNEHVIAEDVFNDLRSVMERRFYSDTLVEKLKVVKELFKVNETIAPYATLGSLVNKIVLLNAEIAQFRKNAFDSQQFDRILKSISQLAVQCDELLKQYDAALKTRKLTPEQYNIESAKFEAVKELSRHLDMLIEMRYVYARIARSHEYSLTDFIKAIPEVVVQDIALDKDGIDVSQFISRIQCAFKDRFVGRIRGILGDDNISQFPANEIEKRFAQLLKNSKFRELMQAVFPNAEERNKLLRLGSASDARTIVKSPVQGGLITKKTPRDSAVEMGTQHKQSYFDSAMQSRNNQKDSGDESSVDITDEFADNSQNLLPKTISFSSTGGDLTEDDIFETSSYENEKQEEPSYSDEEIDPVEKALGFKALPIPVENIIPASTHHASMYGRSGRQHPANTTPVPILHKGW